MTERYAHSLAGQPRSNWQTLEEHSENTARLAARFASAFNSQTWSVNAAWLHDIGKLSDVFQAYLLRENDMDDAEYDLSSNTRINHSSAGAAHACDLWNRSHSVTLAYLVAGHHAGLPDYNTDKTGRAGLTARLEEGRANLKDIKPMLGHLGLKIQKLHNPGFVTRDNYHLWVRFLFSCLVDADFLDTEQFMNPALAALRKDFAPLSILKSMFDRHMQKLTTSADHSSAVNIIRSQILANCKLKALERPGLFSLTVPTGGGKTLSSMAFAFEHARQHGHTRIIYVIPYTSIIEQTVDVFRGIFGASQVVEHHSNLDPAKETERTRLASENWDAPIVVTTNVQFFESFYAAKPGRCRKLHNVVNSIVVLDEAQLIPPQWLKPCVDLIGELVKNYQVTFLLATATQPALPGLQPLEIVDNVPELYQKLKRVNYDLPQAGAKYDNWDLIAAELKQERQVLCVVNTRRDCYDLFKLMPEGTLHLSGLMHAEHRTRVIAEIKNRLKKDFPIAVISTQLVEAGVDIDFPVVYRALAGGDSIVQAAGRCNREGKLEEKGLLKIFRAPSPPPKGLQAKAAVLTEEFIAMDAFMPHDPKFFQSFFQKFYSRVNTIGEEYLRDLIQDTPYIPFRSAADKFHLIDDKSQGTVIVAAGVDSSLIEELKFAGPNRALMRKLQRFVVTLPKWLIEKMAVDGRLRYLDSEKAAGFVIQGCIAYNEQTGLDIYAEQLPVDKLIM